MILVDSSVWIDYFRGTVTAKTSLLDRLLQIEEIAIGDLILTEVLQGFTRDRDFNGVRSLLTSLDVVRLGGEELAIEAARTHRKLRAAGFTVRKTIDTLIATWCIEHRCPLLHCDKDFDAFETHLGLQIVHT